MELVRFADKYNVVGLEMEMAQYIRGILVNRDTLAFSNPWDVNTAFLSRDHIVSATFLPRGHPVRQVLAAASVRGYLQNENYKFARETQDYPSFGADLLLEVRLTLNRVKYARSGTFKDPLDETFFQIDFNVAGND
jgi:hypothetical protein